MGRVIVVTGPPGAGKSTVAEALASMLGPSALVEGDRFFAFLRVGAVAPWLEAAAAQNEAVIGAAAACVGRLASEFDVVYDGVVGPWYLPAFLRDTGLTSVDYAILMPPLEVCLDRVATRRAHAFTDLAAAEHMWGEFRRSTDGLEQHVIDGTADPAETARVIEQRSGGGTLEHRESPGVG